MKTYINGHLYFKAHQEGWLTSLAYFIHWSALYRHKRFNIRNKKNKTTLYKHLHILQQKGLLTYQDSVVTLLSNKSINVLFGGKEKLFTNKTQLTAIKKFLSIVPSLSNLSAQDRKESIRDEFRKLMQNKGLVSKSVYNAFKRKRKKFKSAKDFKIWVEGDYKITLSNNGICKVQNCCYQTAVKKKRVLAELGLCFNQKSFKKLTPMSFKEYQNFRSNLSGLDYSKIRYWSGWVVEQQSNSFTLLY